MAELPIVPTSFVLEVVERANDRLLDRIDALDSFLGVLMTAILAMALLALDRFRLAGSHPDVAWGWATIALLSLAFGCAAVGWLRGNDVLLRKLFRYGAEEEQDAPIPRRFIWGVGTKGERALTDTIRAIEASFSANLPIRTYKRHLAAAALMLLACGTVTAGVAKVGDYPLTTREAKASKAILLQDSLVSEQRRGLPADHPLANAKLFSPCFGGGGSLVWLPNSDHMRVPNRVLNAVVFLGGRTTPGVVNAVNPALRISPIPGTYFEGVPPAVLKTAAIIQTLPPLHGDLKGRRSYRASLFLLFSSVTYCATPSCLPQDIVVLGEVLGGPLWLRAQRCGQVAQCAGREAEGLWKVPIRPSHYFRRATITITRTTPKTAATTYLPYP